MEERIEKAQLLDNIRAGHIKLVQLLATLDEQQMTATPTNGEWSFKDILAHLIEWQKVALNRMHAAARGTEPTFQYDVATDIINKRFFEKNKNRALSDVLADLNKTHMEVIEAVQALSEDDLNNPHRYTWWEGEPLWPNISGNTYEHLEEHMKSIKALIINR